MLQAETELDLISWLEVFESAKQHQMKNSKDALNVTEDEPRAMDAKYYAEEDECESVSTPPLLRKFTSTSMRSDAGAPRPADKTTRYVHLFVSLQLDRHSLKYPDTTFERRNEELHTVLRSVPADDYVLDSFPSALQKENVAIQGRVYLTQNRICFYSNILSSVTTVRDLTATPCLIL